MARTRTIQIRAEGWAIFRGWVQALAEAEVAGESVPAIQDIDDVVAWLHEHGEIRYPVDTDQARVLIETCVKGGRGQVREL